MRHADDDRSEVNFTNGTIETTFSQYQGTDTDIKRAFELKHEADQSLRDTLKETTPTLLAFPILLSRPDHFFVTGEQLTYVHAGAASTQAIGIASTSFVGVGTTDKVPGTVFAIKVDDNKMLPLQRKSTQATQRFLILPALGWHIS